MRTFTDTAGRTWTLKLNLGTAMAIKDKLGIDLLQPESPPATDPSGPPVLTRLGTDEMLLGEVLCAMLEKQLEAHRVTEDGVRSAFDGQTLLAAQKAFYEEMIDFFRSRGRQDRAKAVAKQVAMIDAAIAAIETKIDAVDPRKVAEEAIEAAGETSGGGVTFGLSPEASDSEPGIPGSGG